MLKSCGNRAWGPESLSLYRECTWKNYLGGMQLWEAAAAVTAEPPGVFQDRGVRKTAGMAFWRGWCIEPGFIHEYGLSWDTKYPVGAGLQEKLSSGEGKAGTVRAGTAPGKAGTALGKARQAQLPPGVPPRVPGAAGALSHAEPTATALPEPVLKASKNNPRSISDSSV